MSKPSEFEDRFAIRELIDRFCDSINERDWEAFAACFVEDGVWDVGPPISFRNEGKSQILKFVSTGAAELECIIQTAHAVKITSNGDAATARSTMRELMRAPDGSGMQIWGTYYDILVRTAEGWQFKQRKLHLILHEAQAPSGTMLKVYNAPA
jgi:uncharacterized protein (TIGR02246 family)